MKKLILILALVLAAMPVYADTATIGAGSADTSAGLPVDLGYSYSASQSIYTPAELNALPDGVENAADIKSITARLNLPDAYWLYSSYDFKVTLYVKEIEETAFAQDASKAYIPFDFSDAKSAVLIGSEELMNIWDIDGTGDGCPITFDFSDDPVRYEGKSLLLTWICRIEADWNVTGSLGDPAFNPGRGVTTLRWGNSKTEITPADMVAPVSGTLQKDEYLPVLDIVYDVVELVSGPIVVEGEPAELKVGTYDDDDLYGSRPEETMPVNTVYSNFGSQLLYTTAELAELPTVDAEGNKVTPKITALTFKLAACAGAIYEQYYDIHATVYVENTSLTSIPENNGTPVWIDFSKENSTSFKIDLYEECWENVIYGCDDVIELTVNLDTPIEYTGESLLVTFDGANDMTGEALISQTVGFKTSDNQSACFASDRMSFTDALSSTEPQVNKYLPVMKVHYTPLVEKGGEAKNIVSFESVEPMLMTATVDPALKDSKLTGINDFKKLATANYVAIAYTISDAQAGEGKSYEIMLDNKSLGTVNSTSGVIKYVNPAPVSDFYLKVVPTDENSVGKATTVELERVQAVMPQPEISVVKSKYYMTVSDTEPLKTDVHAAVKFQVGVPEDAVASVSVSSDSSNPQRRLLNDGNANDDIEFDSDFFSADAENWSQLHLNNRCLSFYYPNVNTGEYVDGNLVIPARTFSGGIKATITYPSVYQKENQTVVDGVAMLSDSGYDIDESNVLGFTYKDVQRTPLNEKYNGVQFTIEAPRIEDLSGIESVIVDADVPVEYFNLQGVRVDNPENGLYIRRQGNRAAKVLVK